MKRKNSLFSSVKCLIVALILVIEITSTPFKAFAFDEKAIKLDIDTTSIEVKNAWQQIKNAAVIHLVAQKMQVCVHIGQVILNADDTGGVIGTIFGGTVWPSHTGKFIGMELPIKGVLDKGNVFKTAAILSGDSNTNIGVGPWMSSLFKGQDDGIIECNDRTGSGGGLFDMFVYILKNYRSGMNISDLENASVTESDRLAVVCSKDSNGDYTQPGLLIPSNDSGRPNSLACNSPSVKYYTGVSISQQEAYIKQLYEEMRAASGNSYILPWDSLGYYDEVDGYYLYSNDFSKQCGSADFSTTKGNGDNYIKGYKISNSGKVTEGYYKINSSSDISRQSFVSRSYTCSQLLNRMNEVIGPYIKKVNYEVYKTCKTGVDEAIDGKRNEINEKYINNDSASAEEVDDANKVLAEYSRIQSNREYVATKDDDGNEVIQHVFVPLESEMPTDHIYTCRSHLPFIDVVVQEEADLSQALEDEFYDACYDTVDLAWVICPIINGLTGITDTLNNMVEDFF